MQNVYRKHSEHIKVGLRVIIYNREYDVGSAHHLSQQDEGNWFSLELTHHMETIWIRNSTIKIIYDSFFRLIFLFDGKLNAISS